MSDPFVSVIIPTHNRSKWLRKVVSSLVNQTYPAESYEILIVDNASQDDTCSTALELIQQTHPFIYYLFEPQLGISAARNCGALASKGKVIAFIDDDAVAEPGWLAAIARIFDKSSDVICVGGRIELWWEKDRPEWFGVELEGYLGGNQSLGEQEISFPPKLYPFGGNMAIKKSAYLSVPGGFDSRFGHYGKRLGAHDETRMVDHLRGMGKIIYSPDAKIHHFTPAERGTRGYLVRRSYQIGKADAELDQQRQRRTQIGLLRSAVANTLFLTGDISRWIWHQLRGHQKQAAFEFVVAASRLGRIIRTFQLFVYHD